MSYWQRGCDDAKAARPPIYPERHEPPDSVANSGYANGYDYGKRKYLGSLIGQKIMARELGSTVPDGVSTSDGKTFSK
jgi:hypothetical protein